MKKLTVVLSAMVMLVLVSGQAFASTASTDDPYYIGSWAQRFNEDGKYGGLDHQFNKIEVFNISGNSWEAPGMTNFSATGWGANMVNGGYVVATGSSVPEANDSFQWDLHFLGNASESSVFDILVYDGNNLLGDTRATWNGVWSYATITTDDYNRNPVPEPATMMLFGAGLIGLAGIKKVRSKK